MTIPVGLGEGLGQGLGRTTARHQRGMACLRATALAACSVLDSRRTRYCALLTAPTSPGSPALTVCRSARPEAPLAVSGESAAEVLRHTPGPRIGGLASGSSGDRTTPREPDQLRTLLASAEFTNPAGQAKVTLHSTESIVGRFSGPGPIGYLTRGGPLSVLKQYIERQKKPD
jgi:hypothetical protein